MIDDARDALRAGLRCLLDATLWRQLARAALAWPVLLRVIGALLLLVICTPIALLLMSALGDVPVFFAAWWLTPLAMRRAGAIVSERAFATSPALATGAPLPLPPASAYRAWWGTFLFCTTVLPHWVDRLPWSDTLPMHLALFAAQVLAAPGALMRTLLARRFRIATIDESLAQQRGFWLLVVVAWMALVVAVEALVAAISPNALVEIGLLFAAIKSGHLAGYLLLRTVLWIGVSVATGIFTTAVLARFAAASMRRLGVEPESASAPLAERPRAASPAPIPPAPAPVAPRAPVAPLPRPTSAKSAAPSRPPKADARSARPRAAARTHPGTWLIAVLVILGATYWARGQLVFYFLDDDLRADATNGALWGDPATRADLRVEAACQGRAGVLRKLAWAGIVNGSGPESGTALGCAAYHGHLDAVKALVDAGDDIDALARPVDAMTTDDVRVHNGRQRWTGHGIELTPLQEAVRTPAGLEVAEWLLAHGARRGIPVPGPGMAGHVADTVAVAAADNCLPCLEWLRRHDFDMNTTVPATPLAVWFDNPAQLDRDDDRELVRLLDLGLSARTVGADTRSALHAAAAAGNPSAVRLLLAREADAALADRDGMKPIFYAAQRLTAHQLPGPAESADQRARRLALVIEMIAATPSLDGAARPVQPRLPAVLADPYISRLYDFSKVAVENPEVRAAAAAAGKAIAYREGSVIARLPPAEARQVLGPLDDVALAQAMPPESQLAFLATQGGWWPELARAVRGWPRGQPGYDACNVLMRAVAGVDDASPGRTASWAVVDAWLDLGARPEDCRRGFRDDVNDLAARRSRAQQDDWHTRMAAQDARPRP